jgi:nucleotide-binding universal stress UspA family protein
MLAGMSRHFTQSGVPVTVKTVEGSPAAVIAREAEEGGHDLIVMGSRGLGLEDGESHLLGSVTDRVLRRVSCPVLTVRQ